MSFQNYLSFRTDNIEVIYKKKVRKMFNILIAMQSFLDIQENTAQLFKD